MVQKWNCGRNNYEKDEIMYNGYSGIMERRNSRNYKGYERKEELWK